MQQAASLSPPGFRGPTGLALVREASLVVEAARLTRLAAISRPIGRMGSAVAPGITDPVLLVPGFMVGDCALRPMSWHLRGLGYRTYRARIRSNSGCLEETADRLERRIELVANQRERPVVLVGHSLGGLLSRGLAARRPDLVSAVVTLGSPLLAPRALHPLLLANIRALMILERHGFPKVMGADCSSGECARAMWEQARRPLAPGLHFTSVYSRRDGMMDWRACLDPEAQHVEVRTSHLGMAIDPRVFDVVAGALTDLSAKQRRRDLRVAGE